MSVEAMKLALEALEETRNALAWFYDSYPQDVTKKGNKLLPHVETVLTTLREALVQPQQEPVAWMNAKRDMTYLYGPYNADDIPLYTSPPARKPLTDEEMEKIAAEYWLYPRKFVRVIEAAHGIKENT